MALIQIIFLLIPSVALYLFWRFALQHIKLRRKWLVALTFGSTIFFTVGVFWLTTRETWVLEFASIAGLLSGISVFLWPITSPSIRKMFEQLGFK